MATKKVDTILENAGFLSGISDTVKGTYQFLYQAMSFDSIRYFAKLYEMVHWILHGNEYCARPLVIYILFCGGVTHIDDVPQDEFDKALMAGYHWMESRMTNKVISLQVPIRTTVLSHQYRQFYGLDYEEIKTAINNEEEVTDTKPRYLVKIILIHFFL